MTVPAVLSNVRLSPLTVNVPLVTIGPFISPGAATPVSVLQLPKLPGAAGKQHWGNLPGAALSLAVAEAASAAKRFTLLLTADSQSAERLQEELAFFAPDLPVLHFPDWETLPYDVFSPHQDIISQRIATLYRLPEIKHGVLVVPIATALHRLAPTSFLLGSGLLLDVGQKLDVEEMRTRLEAAGYRCVDTVYEHGEFAVRGALIDLFPMGSDTPYRIDLFDDEVESIRTFDVDTQRTVFPTKEIRLLPAREFPMDDKGRTHFRQAFREAFEGDPAKSGVYKDVTSGIASAGIEYYLPLFFDATATVFDYLPVDAVFVTHGDAPAAIAAFWAETRSRYNLLQGDKARPLLPPDQLFLSDEAFFTAAKSYGRVVFSAKSETPAASALPDIAIDRRAEDPLGKLKNHLAGFPGRVLLLAESAGRRETLATMLAEHGLKPAASVDFSGFAAADAPLALGVGPLHGGFAVAAGAHPLAFITETELYAGSPRRTRREAARKASFDNWLKDLTELKIGDPVVHESHGIGRYRGLIRMDLGTGEQEFLELHYANDAKLFVPVAQLHVISRYSGAEPEAAPLHTLGSGQWEKAKRKAAEQARDTAAELLTLYAARAARQGHAFSFQENDYEAFADGFGFEETDDQAAAIAAVIEDMRSGKPMDRLVCGDVGFGKTEVALRAAFCAVAGGKQVAVLCPTTLLCEQHYQTFVDRFADWPVKIAEISRFKTAKESAQALQELAEGKIDIIIGTHKLIGKDVRFKRLGLVVIDEEHRFGVRQKETLKAMRAEVDVLTLTATPIPRTLAMSMEGLRDFSVIATAPQKRLAIKTFVSKFSDGIIREAVLRELKRGGQVYFLHNEVDTIENMREKLEKLVPEARIVIGHGQMNERELERVMRDFTQQRANLLLCTTIIETGIDNPHANTILINRSEKFGLAQLHQLRGRVGRSHHQAYAYLLVQDDKAMTKQAKQRLEAIQMSEELGSGFFLAMHYLEIRGAG